MTTEAAQPRVLPGLEPEGAGLRTPALEAFYRSVADTDPFVDPAHGWVVVARHEDIVDVLHRPDDFVNSTATLFPHFELSKEATDVIIGMGPVPGVTAGGDGDVHRRGRKAARATFPTSESKVKSQLSGLVEQEVAALIDEFPEHARPLSTPAALGATATGREWKEVDLIRNFAWELPLRVICKIVGFPPERYAEIKKWSEGQITLVWGRGLTPEQEVEAAQGLANLWELCKETIALRRSEPQEDMATRLVRYADKTGEYANADDDLSDEEAAAILLNMAVAGHETTANAIGNGLNYMLSNPELWDYVTNHPERIPDVAEELLRLHPSIITWSRRAARDTTIAGVPVAKGQLVVMGIGAGNRDENVFANPHQFQPGREGIKGDTLTFGEGLHYCIGAPLARLEMTEAIRQLAARHPELTPRPNSDEERAAYQQNIAFRALRTLPGVVQLEMPQEVA